MRKVSILLVALLTASLAWAVPAKRTKRLVKQADGTTIEVRLVGDEYCHYWQTADGSAMKEQADGTFVKLAEKPSMTSARRTQSEARRAKRATDRRRVGSSSGATGNKKGIIILVNYNDKKMVHTQNEFLAQMNEPNYNKDGHIGSLSDYFYDQSYGQLNIDFDVVGPYTVSQNLSYYGQNVGGAQGEDRYPGTLITEAIKLADADGVDFSKYDWNGDKEVDQVFVIYAGYGEASGAPANTIWPHEWSLESAKHDGSGGNGAITLDGVTIDTYACSSELAGTSGSYMDGIGTAAHEFSHCLGLPDFYDTGGSDCPGMSIWSLMDYGCYNGDGCVPSPYTAYERWYSGWLTPTELREGCEVENMKPITQVPEAYIIYNEKTPSEYYILENHQQTHSSTTYRNWDKEAYAHGMLVLHVDYDASAWILNEVNNVASRQRMTIVPANNKHEYYFDPEDVAGNTYPGTGKKTALTNTTTPAAKLYNANSDGKKFLNKPIENITEKNGLISFVFNGGTPLDAPELDQNLQAVDSTGFVANWSAIDGVTSYTLEIRDKSVAPTKTLFVEDFATNSKFDVTLDGTKDISGGLDDYLTTTGWTGVTLYTSSHKLKLGTGSATGRLTSPTFQAPADGLVTVLVTVSKYGSDTGSLNVLIKDASGASLSKQTITPDGAKHELTFEGVTTDFRISFETTTKRAYLNAISAEMASNDKQNVAAKPQLIENITGTTYTVTNLNPRTTYGCRVKAVSGVKQSDWSSEAIVTLPGGTTAIESLFDAKESKHEKTIYNLTGQRVVNPSHGIFVVNGKKVLIR